MSSSTKGIADPDRGWRLWHIDEIFDPDARDGKGRYVPNVDDLVFSYTQGWLRVVNVDYYTGRSELRTVEIADHISDDEDNVLIGRGPDTSYRAYLDTNTLPYKLAIDARIHLFGSDNDRVKIIHGSDIENGEVISRFYNKDQKLVGDYLPLEEETLNDGTSSKTVKTVKVGHCSKKLDDGDVVTLVAYDKQGFVTLTARLLIKNTAWMREIERPTKYVTGIEIESDYLSPSDDKLIEIPINFPLESLTIRGVVHYDDGSSKRMPIDGSKFAILGLNNFIASVLGYRQRATLIYYLSSDEQAYDSLDGVQRHVAKTYTFKTTHIEGAYSVKLFTYPVWQNEDEGYRLEHYLYTLNRKDAIRVNADVKTAENSESFDPKKYGKNQVITFALNLADVSGNYHHTYNHLQTVYIRLDSPGTVKDTTSWTVGWEDENYHYKAGRHQPLTQSGPSHEDYRLSSRDPRDRHPYRGRTDSRDWEDKFESRKSMFNVQSVEDELLYGREIAAKAKRLSSDEYELKIDSGASNQNDWLEKLYYATRPLYDPATEEAPPRPTHFKLKVGNFDMIYSIDKWNEPLIIPKQIVTGTTIFLFWRKYIGDTDLQLAVSAMIVERTDT